MIEVASEIEPEIMVFNSEVTQRGRQKMIDGGMEMITFSPADAEWYIELSKSALWDRMKEIAPSDDYEKAREFLAK